MLAGVFMVAVMPEVRNSISLLLKKVRTVHELVVLVDNGLMMLAKFISMVEPAAMFEFMHDVKFSKKSVCCIEQNVPTGLPFMEKD